HLDPLLDLDHLAPPQARVAPPEVVVDPDSDDSEAPGGRRGPEPVQVGRPRLREVDVLELDAPHPEDVPAVRDEAQLVHRAGVEGAGERPADAAEPHAGTPPGGATPPSARSTSACRRGLALQTRVCSAWMSGRKTSGAPSHPLTGQPALWATATAEKTSVSASRQAMYTSMRPHATSTNPAGPPFGRTKRARSSTGRSAVTVGWRNAGFIMYASTAAPSRAAV